MIFRIQTRGAAMAVLLGCLALNAAAACTIPVFRYALDRWPADPYTLKVPAALLTAVGPEIMNAGANGTVNLSIGTEETASGGIELQFPASQGVQSPPLVLAVENLPKALRSPLRQEIARRITEGDSAVLVLEHSGDAPADGAAEKFLRERLAVIEATARIPEQDPTDPANMLGAGPPLRVAFSLLTLSRDDPEEQALLAMLHRGLPPEERGKGGPVLYLVFGRGRVLAALPSQEFSERNIDGLCQFVLDACSCQVKDMNPGWDLLMDFDWDGELNKVGERSMGASPALVTEPVLIAHSPAPSAGPDATGNSGRSPAVVLSGLLAALAVVAAGFFYFWK